MALTSIDILGLSVSVSSTGTDIYIPVSSVLGQTTTRISGRTLMATSLPTAPVGAVPTTDFLVPLTKISDGLAYSVSVSTFMTALHGIPGGGTTNQILGKVSNTDYDVAWQSAGTVFSVGLSMPAVFSVAGSPITGSGTFAVTANGTSGGIPYFNAPTTMASSGVLAANQIMLGGGAATTPATLGSLGTATTVLHGNNSGAPSFSAVSLTADVSGVLPVASGGTNASSASITAFNNITGYTAAGATGTTSTSIVFSTSPTLVTPVLGTPQSGNLANCTGFPASGITGQLPLANGGTNANLTASNGGIFYSTASAGAILAGTATANQILLSGSSTTPAWSTATYPATATVGTILNAGSANVLSATATPTLGASGTLGTLAFGNATSGTVKLQPVAGALSSSVLTMPAITDTLAGLALANGGTNAALVASNGGVVYSTASALAILAGTATANLPLLSGSSTTPSWAAVSHPTSANSGGIPYFSSTSVMGTSATLTQFGPVYGGGSGATPVSMAAATDGQLIVGQTSAAPLWKTASGDLTVAASGAFTIAANAVTLAKLATQATNTVLANVTAGTAVPTAATLTSIIDTISGASTQGAILYRGSSAWSALSPGSAGRVLTTNGGALDPSWNTVSGTGTVTQINAGTGVVGGPITTTGTLGLQQLVPGGRLTLTSSTPVMTADTAAAQNIYYAPYNHPFCPVYNGSNMQLYQFTASTTDAVGLTLALAASANWVSGSVYDLFYADVSGVFYFGTGPAWSTTLVRGTGAGTTELQMYDGIWTNKVTMTLRYGAASTVSVPANQATYLGSFYCGGAAAGNGTCDMTFKPAAASGGNNAFLALYNAYNRVPMESFSRDSTATWSSSATVSYVPWNSTVSSGTSNRVTVLDGLAQSPVLTSICMLCNPVNGAWTVGITQDSTTAQPGLVGGGSVTAANTSAAATENFVPALGLHYYQAMMKGTSAGSYLTFNGAPFSAILVRLDM